MIFAIHSVSSPRTVFIYFRVRCEPLNTKQPSQATRVAPRDIKSWPCKRTLVCTVLRLALRVFSLHATILRDNKEGGSSLVFTTQDTCSSFLSFPRQTAELHLQLSNNLLGDANKICKLDSVFNAALNLNVQFRERLICLCLSIFRSIECSLMCCSGLVCGNFRLSL